MTEINVPHIDFDEPTGNPQVLTRHGYGLRPLNTRRPETHWCPVDGSTYVMPEPNYPPPPLFRPDYALISCRGCGRRLYNDDGNKIKLPWWRFWKWGC